MNEITWGILFGAGWGACNLLLLAQLLRTFILTKHYLRVGLFLLLKFPLLYATGYWILSTSFVNPWGALVGLILSLIGASALRIRAEWA